MPRGSSLLDELQQAEAEAEHEASDEAAGSTRAPIAAPSPLSAAATAAATIDGPVPVVDAHTPLAKYLSRIHSGGAAAAEAEAEADTRETTEEAADDQIEDEGEPPSHIDEDSAAAPPSSSRTLIASLALEIVAPAACSCFLPRCTLAARSKQWCIQMLTASTAQSASSLNSATVLRTQQRSMHAQISSQLSRIRCIYFGSLVFSLLQCGCFGVQLLWLGLQQMGVQVILPLLLGSSASALSAQSDASMLWPFVCLLLLSLSLLNLAATLANLRSSTVWHSLLVSASSACGSGSSPMGETLGARFESQSKSLILQLMERELVKRGYQLPSSNSHGSSKGNTSQTQGFVPIERMDAASTRSSGGAGSQQSQQSEDGSTRIRIALRDMFLQQSHQLHCMHRLILQITAELDAFAASAEACVDPPVAAIGDAAASSALPSIVQLKSMRSQWIHDRSMLVSAFFALLNRLCLSAPTALCIPPLRSDRSIESQLARAFLQLHITLSGHLATMDSLLPPSSSSVPPAAADAQPELPASRRSLQQALCDVHSSIRSADRRLQIAMERQQPVKSAATAADDDTAATLQVAMKQRAGTSLFDQIRSELFPSRLLPSLGDASAAAAPAATAVAPWSSPLSSSFATDVAYLRTLLVQLHRHCDALEGAVKNADADAGLDPDAAANGAQKPAVSVAESLVSQNDADAASAFSSATAADANLSQSDLLAAMLSMRRHKNAATPSGMGAVFEGSGAFTDPALRPRPRAAAPSAVAAPAVSIFTILSELKSVLHNRPQAYEYIVHNREENLESPAADAASGQQERKHRADN